MKQTVRRDALNGIHEYHTDATAVRTKEREDAESFARAYAESIKEEMAEERRVMLSGIDPDTGKCYTPSEFRSLIDHMELTQEEWHDVSMRLTAEADFIEFDEHFMWTEHV